MPNHVSLKDVLNDKEGRRLVDALEDVMSSLRHQPSDPTLKRLLVLARDELQSATGYRYSIEDQIGADEDAVMEQQPRPRPGAA